MTEFNFPEADEPLTTAIRLAIDYTLARFDSVLGIIVAGSILHGEGDKNSDVDTFIIFEGDYRQRIQKFFNGVRFELFANAVEFVPLYFEEERRTGTPSTAHMLTTGHLVLNRSPKINDLVHQAQNSLDAGADYNPKALISERYHLADTFENAFDLRYRDPHMGLVLLDSIISGMMVYQFKKHNLWIPRHKDLLNVTREKFPDLADLIVQYQQSTGDKRFDASVFIADRTIGTRGFFEWESDKDYLD